MFNLVKISSTNVELSTGNGARLLTIGERLREERQRLGYNQGDFGALAGVSKTTQLNYEKGERNPDAVYLAAVSAAGVDVLYVLTGSHQIAPAAGLSDRESTMLNRYRQLSEDLRVSLELVTESMVAGQSSASAKPIKTLKG